MDNIGSCKTTQLPEILPKPKRRHRQKKDEFLNFLKNFPIFKQKALIAVELRKIENTISLLNTTNPQHVITRKKLEKRFKKLSNFIAKIESPPVKTAQMPETNIIDFISTPRTAISPVLERNEEKLKEIQNEIKLQPLNEKVLPLLGEKILLQQKIWNVYQKRCRESYEKSDEIGKKCQKILEKRENLDKIIVNIKDEHQNVSNEIHLLKPKITEMEQRVKNMKKKLYLCNVVTSKMNSGDSVLPWKLWFVSPLYNFCIFILFCSAFLRDQTKTFFNVLSMDKLEQKRLKT